MFCEMVGLGHGPHNIEKVTHYVRHACNHCSYYAVFGMCDACSKVFREYIRTDGMREFYPNKTFCPKCKRRTRAHEVWTVYESVEE
jgi:hypothetical protein